MHERGTPKLKVRPARGTLRLLAGRAHLINDARVAGMGVSRDLARVEAADKTTRLPDVGAKLRSLAGVGTCFETVTK